MQWQVGGSCCCWWASFLRLLHSHVCGQNWSLNFLSTFWSFFLFYIDKVVQTTYLPLLCICGESDVFMTQLRYYLGLLKQVCKWMWQVTYSESVVKNTRKIRMNTKFRNKINTLSSILWLWFVFVCLAFDGMSDVTLYRKYCTFKLAPFRCKTLNSLRSQGGRLWRTVKSGCGIVAEFYGEFWEYRTTK
jgi:hypothetical protein